MPDEKFMQRCLDLALNANGMTAPNPLVGAVLVHNNRIISEGFHTGFGQPHAEVEAINNLPAHHRALLDSSTLYVNLEPCAHHGKTPPCADMIIRSGIKKVVIGAADPNPLVNGNGIDKLQRAGVDVTVGVLEHDCINLNKPFYTWHIKQRPFVILKWAESADGFFAPLPLQRLQLSNRLSHLLTHKWRSEVSAIMIGYNTASMDDPQLNVRAWRGKNPVRVVYDPQLLLRQDLKLFNGETDVVVLNHMKEETQGHITYTKTSEENWTSDALRMLYEKKFQSVMIEGGSNTIQAFIENNLWDEARVFIGQNKLSHGLEAPCIKSFNTQQAQRLGDNTLTVYTR